MTNFDVLVSVIIPVYRVADYLEDCVQSVISQTYSNLEIILVDDGSPDECPALCDDLAFRDSRIRVIHKQNGGLSDARNVGLAEARGGIVSFVDSDDQVEPTMIETMLRAMVQEGADIACCCVKKIYPNREVVQTFPRDKIYSKRKAVYELIKGRDLESFAWNKLYRRDVLGENPFPVRRVFEDMLAMPHVFQRINKAVHVKENLYIYHRRATSILGTWTRDVQAEFTRAQQDRFLYLEPLWPEFSNMMIERYAWSLKDLCNRALESSTDDIRKNAELLSEKLYPFYREHRALLEPFTTEMTRKKYDVLLGNPNLFALTWPTVRKIRTGIYNLHH